MGLTSVIPYLRGEPAEPREFGFDQYPLAHAGRRKSPVQLRKRYLSLAHDLDTSGMQGAKNRPRKRWRSIGGSV